MYESLRQLKKIVVKNPKKYTEFPLRIIEYFRVLQMLSNEYLIN